MESYIQNPSTITNNPSYQFNILSSFDINQIFPNSNNDNAILSLKINPNISNEFIIINSNFSMNYIQIKQEGMTCLGEYKGHTARINDVCFCRRKQELWNRIFFSGSNDGTIKLWKSDSKQSVYSISTHGKGAVITLDCNEMILCAGFGMEVCMWEIDKMKQIGKTSFAHSDLVSCVRLRDKYLITGGEDNIINVFDLSIGIDKRKANPKNNNINILDQEAVYVTVNIEQSITSLNVLEDNYLSAITSVNTFHIINMLTACMKYQFDAKNAGNGTDYIIDSYYDPLKRQAEVVCGSFTGNILLLIFDLTKEVINPYLDCFFNTDIEQMFNSIGRYDDNTFIVCSDKGWIYLLQKQPIK